MVRASIIVSFSRHVTVVPIAACYVAMPLNEIGGSTMLPQAILFDLDETLIQAHGGAEAAWLVVTHEFADDLAPLTPSEVGEAIGAFAQNFWADPGGIAAGACGCWRRGVRS